MSRRPKPVRVHPFRARVTRGPRDGRWYWRVERCIDGRDRKAAPACWATADEVAALMRSLDPEATEDAPVLADCTTLADLLSYWAADVDDRADLAEASRVDYSRRARRLRQRVGHVALRRVLPSVAESYRRTLAREGYAEHTIEADLLCLVYAWRWGREVGLHHHDRELVGRWKRPRPKRERYTPTAGDVAAVLAQLEGWPRDAVRILWGTGMRIGELADLVAGDVDLTNACVRVHGKTGARSVPVGRETLAILRRLVEGVPIDRGLWPVGRYAVHSGLTRHHLTRACDAAEVRRFTPHGLRRAAVDRMLRAGADVSAAAAVTGHSPQVMLAYYRQVTEADRASAAAVLDALPGEVVRLDERRGEGS